jgi:hypothetical protein
VVGGGALRRRPANSAYGPARCDKRTVQAKISSTVVGPDSF